MHNVQIAIASILLKLIQILPQVFVNANNKIFKLLNKIK